jgi:CheY-like chemotaxis protein
MSKNNDFALVPRAPGSLEKAEPGAKHILSSMVADTFALAKKGLPRSQRPLRIVFVDDDDVILEMVGSLIRDWLKNLTLLSYQDGETAWQELLRTDPDLLITDVVRSGMTGCEMLPLLAQRKVKYPILVHSGYATETQVRQWAGPDLNVTFLRKPYSADEFRRQLLIHIGPSDNPERQIRKEAP